MTDATQNPTPVQTIACDTVNIPQTVNTKPIAAQITGIVAFFETKFYILSGASIPKSCNAFASVSLKECTRHSLAFISDSEPAVSTLTCS